MGKFDGVLILSDWDGTLSVGGKVTEKNQKAIKYFCDNGGLFTICSGRDVEHLEAFFDFVRPNTYLIALNGARIYDIDNKQSIYEGFLDSDYIDTVKEIIDSGLFCTFRITFESPIGVVYFNPENFFSEYEPYKHKKVHKIVFETDAARAQEAKDFTQTLKTKNHIFVRSWITGNELLHKENTKGKALLKIKKALNAKLAIAVGDYENDVEMLDLADMSYAVEGACKEALVAAKGVVSGPSESSIADVIFDIESNVIKKI